MRYTWQTVSATGVTSGVQQFTQASALPVTEGHGDPQVLQILVQCFSAQINLAGMKERSHVLFKLSSGEATIPLHMRRNPW